MKIRAFTCIVVLIGMLLSFPTFAQIGIVTAVQDNPQSVGSMLVYSKIAAGNKHTCALTSAGKAMCWGRNDSGQLGVGTTTIQRSVPVEVLGLGNGVTALAAGQNYTCAVTSDGGAKCWGYNASGNLGDGTNIQRNEPVDVVGLTSGVISLVAGGAHTCALTSVGGVKCWGNNYKGFLGDGTTNDSAVPVDVIGLSSGVTALLSGLNYTCALTSEGGVKCWGENEVGQLGTGTDLEYSKMPVEVSGLASGVMELATGGGKHSCVIRTGGEVKCWGANWYGQLGDGSTNNSNVPVEVDGLEGGVIGLATNMYHTCVLTGNGGVKCWGGNEYGQLGDGTMNSSSLPLDVVGLTSGITALAAGEEHTCALTLDGRVKCWGFNEYGQLGDGTAIWHAIPIDVVELTRDITALAAGWAHNCAVTSSGGAKCWGYNDFGQLGDGTMNDSSSPVDVVGLTSGVKALAAGEEHTCALTSEGGVKCWGNNGAGELGDGTTNHSNLPVDVIGLSKGVTAVVTDWYHSCVLTSSGGVKCWGRNDFGQLGNGTTDDSSIPVDVIGLTEGVTALAAGQGITCAVTTVGGAKCWGYNSWGQLGDGTTTHSSLPVEVSGLSSGVSALTAGIWHTCALTTSGGVKCWGYNAWGELGDGTLNNSSIPVDVVGLSEDVTALTGGGIHNCAMLSNGGVKCWGFNEWGQLGDGTTTRSSLPVDVSGFSRGSTFIEAGISHTCALVTGGRPKCWGWDGHGQLGLGIQLHQLIPVDVIDNSLSLNYANGQPDSYFTLTGENFFAGSTDDALASSSTLHDKSGNMMTITVNGEVLSTTFETNETSGFIIFIDTSIADSGFYTLRINDETTVIAHITFYLGQHLPLRPLEGGGQTIHIPAGIAINNLVYLPLLRR